MQKKQVTLPDIPYFQTTRIRVQAMIDLVHITPGMTAADLGAGDGRIVIALAQAGASVVGYESDTTRVQLAQENIRKMQLTGRAIILHRDFWQEDLSPYDIITIYPMPDIVEALEEKLLRELKPNAQVVLNFYPFPHWHPIAEKEHVFLYQVPTPLL